MADDTTARGTRDRVTVSGSEPYELKYLAERHGISKAKAKALIDRVGNDRSALEAAIKDEAENSESKSSRARKPRERVSEGSRADGRRTSTKKSGSNAAVERAASVEKANKQKGGRATESVTKTVAPSRREAASVVRTRPLKAKITKASIRKSRTLQSRADNLIGGVSAAATGRTAKLVGAAAAGLVAGLTVNLGRKVAVQAPSALAGDWFEALKLEHKLALGLFDQLQQTSADETTKRSVLLVQLKHALGKHAFSEENVIYPALRAWGDKADADKLNHDHGYVKQNLYDLEQMDKRSPEFMQTVVNFRSELQAHIREEEDAIFPPLHAALGDAGNARVTALANKEGFKLA